MKIIDIPPVVEAPVKVVKNGIVIEQTIKLLFVDWIQHAADSYPPLGKGGKSARQAAKIADVLANVDGQTVIQFEDADYAVIKAAIEAVDWLPGANRKFLAFYEAIEKAQDVKV